MYLKVDLIIPLCSTLRQIFQLELLRSNEIQQTTLWMLVLWVCNFPQKSPPSLDRLESYPFFKSQFLYMTERLLSNLPSFLVQLFRKLKIKYRFSSREKLIQQNHNERLLSIVGHR